MDNVRGTKARQRKMDIGLIKKELKTAHADEDTFTGGCDATLCV